MSSSQTFSDFHVAAKFRDVMRRLARREIDATLPPDEFGVVTAVNTVDLNASILMTGATESVTIPYTGTAPAVDDEVRVTGRAGSRYISGSGGGGGGGEDEDVEAGEIITYDSTTGIASVLLDNGDTVDVTLISSANEGEAGPAGSIFYNGSGAPSSLLGMDGDYYLDAPFGDIYFKSGGSWSVLMNITDKDTSYVAASSSGAAYTASYLTARVHKLTMNSAVTLTLTGATSGRACGITLYLVQDATGGRLMTWPASVKWPFGVAPTLSTAAAAIDLIVLETFDGGTNWYGSMAGKSYA